MIDGISTKLNSFGCMDYKVSLHDGTHLQLPLVFGIAGVPGHNRQGQNYDAAIDERMKRIFHE